MNSFESAFSRRQFLGTTLLFAATGRAATTLDDLRRGWRQPPRSCRPHTRWWWPGSAVTREGIAWQLDQMRNNGIGGAEIISCWQWFEKGNLQYLSPEWLEMVRYALDAAAARDMELALTFGPGWDFGGFWVPPENRAKVLAACWVDVDGPVTFNGELPRYNRSRIPKTGLFENMVEPEGDAKDAHQILAVVAGKWNGAGMDGESLVTLDAHRERDSLRWNVPAGKWRIAAFRLEYNGQQNSAQNFSPRNWIVDHFDAAAVKHYADFLSTTFRQAFGDRLGRVVDSFFGDSFEVTPLPDSLLWSNGLLGAFQRSKGYDLTRYLPAIWWDIGELTSRIRYDVNHFLHEHALNSTFKPIRESMAAVGVPARIQPHYRFTTEIIQAAGAVPRPETEVTTARFEVVADPRKATVAGARFYGRAWVSAEAYTFIHTERYRATLEELKRGTDAFLRDGITQFYNHGYLYSEERQVAPERDVPFAERISHWNPWWPYYKHLGDYVARGCFLLRQGLFAGEILVYSPQAEVWTRKALWGIERRIMPYGDLPRTLVANGYDFDPVNDDVLQNLARFEKGRLHVANQSYRVLILQQIHSIPPATLRAIARFADSGGVVIALDCLPSRATGLCEWQSADAEVQRLAGDIWRSGRSTHFLPEYRFVNVPFVSNQQQPRPTPPLRPDQSKLLEILGAYVPPEFQREGGKQSDGLTFQHRRAGDIDLFFVTNLQAEPSRETVSFAVRGKRAEAWNGITGEIAPVAVTEKDGRSHIPIDLAPWESRYFLFAPGLREGTATAARTPLTPMEIRGPWQLTLDGIGIPRAVHTVDRLASWADLGAPHCSGSGTYQLDFEVPSMYTAQGVELWLNLGDVAFIADVSCNGRPAGVCWMQPYRLRLTGLVSSGRNHLEVKVTNVLINYIAGLKEPPAMPPEIAARFGSADRSLESARRAFVRDRDFRPLPLSGLLGPVRLEAYR